MGLLLKYYRIVEERSDDDSYIEYRVQERGLFGWRDVRVLERLSADGLGLTKIMRFENLEAARTWINNRRGRTECKKTVLETYALYG